MVLTTWDTRGFTNWVIGVLPARALQVLLAGFTCQFIGCFSERGIGDITCWGTGGLTNWGTQYLICEATGGLTHCEVEKSY